MLNLTAKIVGVKKIRLLCEKGNHEVLLFNEPDEDLTGFLHAMNVGNRIIEIRISGEEEDMEQPLRSLRPGPPRR